MAAPLAAQLFSYGARVGAPLTDAITNAGSLKTSTDRWVFGPSAEIRIPVIGIGVEADLLYRRYTIGKPVSQWEFPILLKYRFPGVILHPFVDAGPSFNHIGSPNIASQILNNSSAGLAIGAGAEVKAIVVRISPELRYTHWGTQNLKVGSLGSSQNQLEFLVGITF
jgi:hypothetical protein